jgi:TatD DNase family protein
MLIDSHCHLDYPALAKDREGVRTRAKAAGVARMVNIGTTKKGFDEVRATAEAHEEIFCSFGVHPHYVNEDGEYLAEDEIVRLASHPKVVGIGETGLDYYYNKSPHDMQQQSFRRHIRAAMKMDLPIIVHSRDAEADTAKILREEGQGTQNPKGVLHCFSSKRILAEEALALDFYISLSGILTFKKSTELRSIAADVPLDRLLVETDSPFLAPEPYRGKICEPAYVAETARVLADIKGVSPEEIARQTTENFFTLFNRVTKP